MSSHPIFQDCCGHAAPICAMYRCRQCGLWLCGRCAERHFGGKGPAIALQQEPE